MTLSLATHHASLPIAHRLYLPEDWAKDRARRDKACVPETIAFQTKPEIAFEQISAAQAAGLPQDVVLMDAGYGTTLSCETNITALGLRYATAKLADIGAALTSRSGEAALRARGLILAISEGLTQYGEYSKHLSV